MSTDSAVDETQVLKFVVVGVVLIILALCSTCIANHRADQDRTKANCKAAIEAGITDTLILDRVCRGITSL